MSRWGLLADVHCENFRVLGGPVTAGVNLRCRLVGDAFARGLHLAGKVGCDRVAVLGDLFNIGKPSPEVIGVAADAIASSPVPVYVIPGNHDRSSDEPGNNALAALREVKNCIVVDEPTYLEDGVILAPFSPRPPMEYFTDVLKLATPGPKFLLGHCGIVGDSTAHFLLESRNAISLAQIGDLSVLAGIQLGVDLRCFASGDWHQHVVHEGLNGISVVQVGALCQANFGDPLEVGKLCVLDTEKGSITEFHDVPGPRFITVDRMDFEDRPGRFGRVWESLEQPALKNCDLFVSIKCLDGEDQQRATALMNGHTDWGVEHLKIAGWKTELVSTVKQQTEVVEAVQGAVQVEDALQEWAAAQPGVSQPVKDRAVQIALECLR